jgi:hypothetical protein
MLMLLVQLRIAMSVLFVTEKSTAAESRI